MTVEEPYRAETLVATSTSVSLAILVAPPTTVPKAKPRYLHAPLPSERGMLHFAGLALRLSRGVRPAGCRAPEMAL